MAADWREKADAVESAFNSSARREGRGYRVLCPFCVSSKTGRADYSLGVNGAGLYFCHRCATSGKMREAPDPGAILEPEEVIEIEPPEGFIATGLEPGLSAMALHTARQYLAKRNIDDERARLLQVGAVLDGYYRGRVIIPVLADDAITWLGWIGRDYTGTAEKPYLYPRGMPRGAHLYNHCAIHEETDVPVMVVEGAFDAIALWPDAVAVLGKPSHNHIDMLATAKRPVAIVLDGDAHDEGWALAQRLRFEGARAGNVRLPPRLDPDQVDIDWLRQRALDCITEAL